MARMSAKCRRRIVTMCRLGVILALVLCVVTPIRNAVLSPVLPRPWYHFHTFRLVQMLMDNQHFPMDPLLPAPASPQPPLAFNLSDVSKFVSKEDPYQDFFNYKRALENQVLTDPSVAEELAMLEAFQPVLSLKERAQLLFTLHVFQTACERNGIQFFICEGSMLGYHRHHGLIPWDDDMDIAVNVADWQKVRRVLGNIPGFTLFAPPDSQWKFYLTDLPGFSDKPFKFPYIDLFFYREHGPYAWSVTWGIKNNLMIQTKHLFPLTTVRWETFRLPAPACLGRMATESYGLNCMTPKYVHKTNVVRFGFQTDKVDCWRLHKYLPFVFREEAEGGRVLESKRVGSRVLHNWTLPPPPGVCSED